MCKPGQNKEGYRGELELKLGFTVKATENNAGGGSVADLRRGTKGSLTSLNKVADAYADAHVDADVNDTNSDADAAGGEASNADTYLLQQGGWHPGGVSAQPGRQGEEEHQEAGQVGGEEGGEGWGEGKADGGGSEGWTRERVRGAKVGEA